MLSGDEALAPFLAKLEWFVALVRCIRSSGLRPEWLCA